MIARARLLLALTRPAVVVLLGLFTVTGMSHAGAAEAPAQLALALVAVIGFLLSCVLVNDLADEAIDRVNLPGDDGRLLVAGRANRRELVVVATVAAAVAIGAGAAISWRAVAVLAGGLMLSLAYSLRPVRLADRGAVASLLLPAGYVAVPFLVGVFSVRDQLEQADLLLLAGLYVGFIGRIVLKDFRDVRGDALFGKRTFLVRHGREATCRLSAACWLAGSAVVPVIRDVTPDLAIAYAACTAAALLLLRELARDGGGRRDEALVAAIALAGRGAIVTIIAHLSMTTAGWTPAAYHLVMGAFALITVGQSVTMARRGPISHLTIAGAIAGADQRCWEASMRSNSARMAATASSSPGKVSAWAGACSGEIDTPRPRR